MNTTKELRSKYGDQAHFVLVYVPDPHPLAPDISPYSGATWELEYSKYRQARDFSERVEDANRVSTNDVFDEVLVDYLDPKNSTGDNPTWCSWGPAPNPGWVLSQQSVLVGQPWFDGGGIEKCLEGRSPCDK